MRPLESDERAEMALLPMDGNFFLSQSGAPALWGEPEYTPLERTTARPTLEVLYTDNSIGDVPGVKQLFANAT